MKRFLSQIAASDARLMRDGNRLFLQDAAPDLDDKLAQQHDELLAMILPAVSAADRVQTQALIGHRAIRVASSDKAAKDLVAEQVADALITNALAIDTETMVLPEYRQPVPVALTRAGTIAKRQPLDGAAGFALDPRHARVRLLQAYAGRDAIALFDMNTVTASIIEPLFHGRHTISMFNAVFDLKFIMASFGIEPTAPIHDTQLAMRLLDPCESWPMGMGQAASLVLDVAVPKTMGASDWSAEQLTSDQLEYAALDVVITDALYRRQCQEFDACDDNVNEIVNGALVPVSRMELAGMPVDTEAHGGFIDLWKQELALAQERLCKSTGGQLTNVPTDNEVRAYLELVLTREQLEEWPRTASGQLAANKKAFASARNVLGLEELAAVKTWMKGLSTYGQAMLDRVQEDGRIHAQFMIAGARTGRFSSRNPNLQNVPIRSRAFKKFREIFRAPPGYQIIAADYSQIELREMAEQSGDEVMLESYRLYGEFIETDSEQAMQHDIHRTTARALAPDLNRLPADEQDRLRSMAKAANFGLIYGSGPNGFRTYARVAFGLELSEDEALDIIDTFRNTYPGVFAWQQAQARASKYSGAVQTLGGRRWYWNWRARSYDTIPEDMEDYQIDDWIAGFERNFSLNMPIQGTCAEVMLVALAYVDQALREMDARIIATVHDEIVLLAAEDDVADVMNSVRRCMTRAWTDFHPDSETRGLVEIKAGATWRDAH